MEKESKVCVIMPVYNGAKTIELALKSLIAQSYTNWQCVIVNDGSTDGTKEILDRLHDPRFLIIHLPENRGRGYARQVALENSSGDYLAYLDADDFYHTEKLKSQVRVLDAHPEIALVSCRCVTYEKGFIPRDSRSGVTTPTLYRFPDTLRFVMPCSLVRLKEATAISYSRRLNGPEDRDYFERYLDGHQYMSLDEPLFFYCLDETDYHKVLSYTSGNIRHAFDITRRSPYKGIRVIIKTSFKWFVYAVFIPILGVDFFLRRRGTPVSDSQKELLRVELERVNQTVLI